MTETVTAKQLQGLQRHRIKFEIDLPDKIHIKMKIVEVP